jgi:hypothetical protein
MEGEEGMRGAEMAMNRCISGWESPRPGRGRTLSPRARSQREGKRDDREGKWDEHEAGLWEDMLARDIGDTRWGTGGTPARAARPAGTRAAGHPDGGHDNAR